MKCKEKLFRSFRNWLKTIDDEQYKKTRQRVNYEINKMLKEYHIENLSDMKITAINDLIKRTKRIILDRHPEAQAIHSRICYGKTFKKSNFDFLKK